MRTVRPLGRVSSTGGTSSVPNASSERTCWRPDSARTRSSSVEQPVEAGQQLEHLAFPQQGVAGHTAGGVGVGDRVRDLVQRLPLLRRPRRTGTDAAVPLMEEVQRLVHDAAGDHRVDEDDLLRRLQRPHAEQALHEVAVRAPDVRTPARWVTWVDPCRPGSARRGPTDPRRSGSARPSVAPGSSPARRRPSGRPAARRRGRPPAAPPRWPTGCATPVRWPARSALLRPAA